jgi:catechol 2,3-dioxygenase-like lactoylglutathione lyase family enzyme
VKHGAYLHHIAMAVSNMDEALTQYRANGFECTPAITDPLQNASLAMCKRAGCDDIELVGAVDENSPVVSILNKSGRYWLPYHLCFAVQNIDGFITDLKSAGISCTLVRKKSPAVLFGGLPVCFVYIKGMGLTELVETDAPPAEKNISSVAVLATKEPEKAKAFLEFIGYARHNRHQLGEAYGSAYSGRLVIDACEDEGSDGFRFYKMFGSCLYSVAF